MDPISVGSTGCPTPFRRTLPDPKWGVLGQQVVPAVDEFREAAVRLARSGHRSTAGGHAQERRRPADAAQLVGHALVDACLKQGVTTDKRAELAMLRPKVRVFEQ